ncbi:MAG: macrolide transporter ATP-binding /permease protein [Candidatus Diapherotrites archaeon ADurb.Bin253]|nr:MAG: macrolide transporter ATP-binding /permease protein [Candidatus Diapherotrites archaeon ADurb.Bin253]HPX74723.1 ABC transporter permease [Candidatus Pacearchaeota archaeon]HQC61130.1 ABC transporter permease [Candidatus Pacearchaeota archaeon]
MISRELINYSLRNIKQRKTRSAFTIISILVGITTIFIFVSFGMGLFNYIEEMSSASSANKVLIQPKGFGGGMDGAFAFSEDEVRVVESTSGVYSATGVYLKNAEIEKSGVKKYVSILGYDPKKPLMSDVFTLNVYTGRELQPGDRGVVLGYNYLLPNKIFSKPYELNDNIILNGRKVKVIGFYASVGNAPDDSQIYVTNDFMEELYSNSSLSYNWIIAKVDTKNIDRVVKDIEKNLRKERGQDQGKEDFFVQSFDDMIESYSTALDIVIWFIVLIALISVFVSAINTANTMITSVLERVKEIGVMKSIGAKDSEIFAIFLFESSFLGFIAGVLGVIFGVALSFLGGKIIESVGYGFLQPAFPAWLFIACIVFATLTGAISGALPSRSASKVNPVDALRYE